MGGPESVHGGGHLGKILEKQLRKSSFVKVADYKPASQQLLHTYFSRILARFSVILFIVF